MVALIWQFLREANLKTKIAFLKFGKFAKLHLARTWNSIYAGAIALTLLTGTGILLAYLGYKADIGWLMGAGQLLIALGGMAATGALCIFYLKVGVLGTHSLHAIDGFLEFISRGKIKNFFSKEVAANIRNDLLNAFAWVAAFCVWCDIVPVWKYPVAIPIGATLAAFFAFASARSWTFVEKPVGKAIVFIALAVVFIVNTANVLTVGAISEWAGERGELAGSYIRNDSAGSSGQREILAARREFVSEAAKARLREYKRLAARQIVLMGDPDGDSEEVKREFAKNAARMRELEGSSHRVKKAGKQNTAPVLAPVSIPDTTEETGDWLDSNWGWVLITGSVLGLLIIACIGLAFRQTRLASAAAVAFIAIALCGSLVWFLQKAGRGEVTSPNITPAQTMTPAPALAPYAPESRERRRSEIPAGDNYRPLPRERLPGFYEAPYPRVNPPDPPARFVRRGLDAIIPEQPGEWQE